MECNPRKDCSADSIVTRSYSYVFKYRGIAAATPRPERACHSHAGTAGRCGVPVCWLVPPAREGAIFGNAVVEEGMIMAFCRHSLSMIVCLHCSEAPDFR